MCYRRVVVGKIIKIKVVADVFASVAACPVALFSIVYPIALAHSMRTGLEFFSNSTNVVLCGLFAAVSAFNMLRSAKKLLCDKSGEDQHEKSRVKTVFEFVGWATMFSCFTILAYGINKNLDMSVRGTVCAALCAAISFLIMTVDRVTTIKRKCQSTRVEDAQQPLQINKVLVSYLNPAP